MINLIKLAMLVIIVLVVLAFVGVQPLRDIGKQIISSVTSTISESEETDEGNGTGSSGKATTRPVPGEPDVVTGEQKEGGTSPTRDPSPEEVYIPEPITPDTKETSIKYIEVFSLTSDYDTGKIIADTIPEMDAFYINVDALFNIIQSTKPGYYDITLESKNEDEDYGTHSIEWHTDENFGPFNWHIDKGKDTNRMHQGMTASETFTVTINYRSYNINNIGQAKLQTPIEQELLKRINIIRDKSGLNLLVYDNGVLHQQAGERTLLRINEDMDLDLPVGEGWREMKFYRRSGATVVESEILTEVVESWLGNKDSLDLLRSRDARSIGISISSGKGFFISVLIGIN